MSDNTAPSSSSNSTSYNNSTDKSGSKNPADSAEDIFSKIKIGPNLPPGSPAFVHWVEQMFPSLHGDNLQKMAAQLQKNILDTITQAIKRLQQKAKEASDELKKSIEGDGS